MGFKPRPNNKRNLSPSYCCYCIAIAIKMVAIAVATEEATLDGYHSYMPHNTEGLFFFNFELELELIQTQMRQKPMLRAEVGMRVRCANKASAECIKTFSGIMSRIVSIYMRFAI